MYNGQTVSLKRILWSILSRPIASDLSYERAAELAIEAIKLLGAPLAFTSKVTNPPLEIVNHKVALPPELLSIKGIRYVPNLNDHESLAVALTYATDVYHASEGCLTDPSSGIEFTYTLDEGIIKVPSVDGFLQIAYKALPVDEEGYPLIPDDEKTKLAIEYYIMFRYLEPLWEMGKITDKVFEYNNQKKCFYMGSASNSLKIADMDHMEAIGNSINRLIINTNAHKNFFKGAGAKERFKRYN
jgi:hypothetical protein